MIPAILSSETLDMACIHWVLIIEKEVRTLVGDHDPDLELTSLGNISLHNQLRFMEDPRHTGAYHYGIQPMHLPDLSLTIAGQRLP